MQQRLSPHSAINFRRWCGGILVPDHCEEALHRSVKFCPTSSSYQVVLANHRQPLLLWLEQLCPLELLPIVFHWEFLQARHCQ